MLAYVFWHQRAKQTDKAEYQQKLVAFHQILQERQPQGFLFSMVLELEQLPWMEAGLETYEDWYVVENSAALDPLDEAAVSGICREPHNQVARLAGNGTGGLYRLKKGSGDLSLLSQIRSATWFNKPAGMSYDRLYERLQDYNIEQQRTLWQRRMTMGPALEYCLHSPQEQPALGDIQHIQVAAHPIFLPNA